MLTSIRHGPTGVTVLRLAGVLDVRSYPQVRDSVMKAALDAGSALIVDVDELEARNDHVWTVFTIARWDNQQWPDIPIALVSADPLIRWYGGAFVICQSPDTYPCIPVWPQRPMPAVTAIAATATVPANSSDRTHTA
jgi:hypothetical protein